MHDVSSVMSSHACCCSIEGGTIVDGGVAVWDVIEISSFSSSGIRLAMSRTCDDGRSVNTEFTHFGGNISVNFNMCLRRFLAEVVTRHLWG